MAAERLWVVVTCMGRLEFVKQTAPAITSQKGCKYVFVDWSCPDGSGDWVQANVPDAIVIRIAGQKVYRPCARNEGVAVVPDNEWVFFMDCDVVARPKLSETLMGLCVGNTFTLPGLAESTTTGLCLCNQRDWKASGGYDDVICSYGHDDHDFFQSLSFVGAKRIRLDLCDLFCHIDHSDHWRLCNFEIKDKTTSMASQEAYYLVKQKEMRRLGRLLSKEERIALYSLIIKGRLQPSAKCFPVKEQMRLLKLAKSG